MLKKGTKYFVRIISHVFPHVLFCVKTLTHFAIKEKQQETYSSEQ